LVAIQNAAKVRASPKKLVKAILALAKGDEEVARLQYGTAIGYYWNAWNYASN
jgi:hypothetical protein